MFGCITSSELLRSSGGRRILTSMRCGQYAGMNVKSLCSGDIYNVTIFRQGPIESQRHGASVLNYSVVHGLDVEVWFGAIAGIPATAQHVTGGDLLSDGDLNTAVLQMAERDDDILMFNEHMITCQRDPSRCSPATLSHGVADRREAAICRMVGFGIVGGHNNPIYGRKDRPSESGKMFRLFRA